jgi:aminotransferase
VKERLARRAVDIKQSSIRAVTRRIEAVKGVNLGQGSCELEPDKSVCDAACGAIRDGHNSYALFDGIPQLKDAILERCREYNRLPIGRENILVMQGATGGLECICKAFLEVGDEVILFEPSYEYHKRSVIERGAVPKFVTLKAPDWSFSVEELSAAFSAKTKLMIFANPNNPTGKVFTAPELQQIGEECRKHRAIAVADEVYEYILGPGQQHISLAALPGLFDHAITISSASKTLFVTGWRVGWLIAPAEVIGPLGVKSDETYVCAPSPLQYGVARGLRLGNDFFAGIRENFNSKRLQLELALRACGLVPLSPQGAYYILADYSALGFADDDSANDALIDKVGVAAVPGNSFYSDSGVRRRTGLLRFCFAVTEQKLSRACELLTSARLTSRYETPVRLGSS